MNLKEFYNPKHVYDGYFESYFIRPFFHHYADFRSGESAKSSIYSFLAWVIVTLGIIGLLMGLVGLLGPEVGFTCLLVAGSVWGALSVIPLIALVVRSFHSSRQPEQNPRLLGVDTLLGVSSLLFFVFGLLMMITTVNSGTLNPNAGMTDEPDTTDFELDEVTEEPIFTYQDEAAPDTTIAVDSLSDMNEQDLVNPEESYDPTLATPEEDLLQESPADTL